MDLTPSGKSKRQSNDLPSRSSVRVTSTVFATVMASILLTSMVTPVHSQSTAPVMKAYMDVQPPFVNAPSRVMYSGSLSSGTVVANGDTLVLTIPAPGVFVASTAVTNCASMVPGLTITQCSVSANQAKMTFGVATTTATGAITNLTVSIGGFKNPGSTMPIMNITSTLTNSAGTIKGSYANSTLFFAPGNITSFKIRAIDSDLTNEYSRYMITFMPNNTIPPNSMITISFPYSFYLFDGPCDLQNFTAPLSSYARCKIEYNTITLMYPFATTSTNYTVTPNSQPLSFVASVGGYNPSNVQDAGGFLVATYVVTQNNYIYPIDQTYFPEGIFTPVYGNNTNSTNNYTYPPYDGTNQTNGTYFPPPTPINNTNGTAPSPANGTNETAPPPVNGTNGTAPPPNYTTNGTATPPQNGTNGSTNGTAPKNSTNSTIPPPPAPTPPVVATIRAVVNSSSPVASNPAIITVMVYPTVVVPVGGVVRIEFPYELIPQNTTQISTNASFQLSSAKGGPNCTLNATNVYYYANQSIFGVISVNLKISNAYTYYASTKPLPLNITCRGFSNPRSTFMTSSFGVSTFDAKNISIENVTQNVTLQMKVAPIINQVNVSAMATSPNLMTKPTNISVSFVTKIALFNGDQIMIQFPQELMPSTTSSCLIEGNGNYLSCYPISNNVLLGSLWVGNMTVPPGTLATIVITNVFQYSQNYTKSNWTIQISDAFGAPLTMFNGIPKVNFTIPPVGVVQYSYLYQTSQALNDWAMYTIVYSTVSDMVGDSSFQIQYPPSVGFTTITNCTVYYQETFYTMQSCVYDFNRKVLNISNGFYATVPAGDKIMVQFGPVINPTTQLNPGTFQLQSFSDSNFTIKLDRIVGGLVPQFDCAYPCNTCDYYNSSQCTSCQVKNKNETKINLDIDTQQCFDKCMPGKYQTLDNMCQPCSSECQTCTDGLTCASCDKYSNTPFMYNQSCISYCPSALCAVNGKCQDCNTAKLSSLSVTPFPSTANTLANLTFNATLDPSKNVSIADGDVIQITMPGPGQFITDDSKQLQTNLCISRTPGVYILYCAVTSNFVSLYVSTKPVPVYTYYNTSTYTNSTNNTTYTNYTNTTSGYRLLQATTANQSSTFQNKTNSTVAASPVVTKFAFTIQNFLNPMIPQAFSGLQIQLIDSFGNTKGFIRNASVTGFTAPLGNYFDSKQTTWVQCPAECDSCFQNLTTGIAQCKYCRNNATFDVNMASTCRRTCSAGLVFDYSINDCTNCSEGSWVVNSKNNTCVQCPNNCFSCQQAMMSTKLECVKCLPGSIFDTTKKLCRLDCDQNQGLVYNWAANQCLPCKKNEYANPANQTCTTCPKYCDSCVANSTSKQVECTSCQNTTGIFFDTNAKLCRPPCANTSFYDNSTASCVDCKASTTKTAAGLQTCTVCPKGCKTCAYNSLKFKIECRSCSATTDTVDFLRKSCRKNCTGNSYYNFDINDCQSCSFDQFTNGITQQCEECPDNCLNCKYNTNGTTWVLPPMNNSTQYNSANQTSSGTVFTATTSVFQPLIFSQIKVNATCTTCYSGQILDADRQNCRPECNWGEFYNWTSGSCQVPKYGTWYSPKTKAITACPSGCTSCIAIQTKPDSSICLSCIDNFIIENSLCRKFCPDGQYYDFMYKNCLKCTFPCLACSGSQQCKVCDDAYTIKDGKTCSSKCVVGKEVWNRDNQTCQTLKPLKVNIATYPKNYQASCRFVTVFTNNVGLNDTDTPFYSWQVSINPTPLYQTINGKSVKNIVNQDFINQVQSLVADANSLDNGATTLMIPEELTELVTVNTTIRFNITMTLGAQVVSNITSILIVAAPNIQVGGLDQQNFTIRAADGFGLSLTAYYPECPTLSQMDPTPVTNNFSIGCQLFNATSNKLIKQLPGTCQIAPNELEMGTNYSIRANYFVSSFQAPITANISLSTVYETPVCQLPSQFTYIKSTDKIILNPKIINKKSSLTYQWIAQPTTTTSKFITYAASNNMNLSVAASTLSVTKYNAILNIKDLSNPKTFSTCNTSFEIVSTTQKTISLTLYDDTNKRNYTDPSQGFSIACFQQDDKFVEMTYVWTIKRKPDNVVLYSSTIQNSLFRALNGTLFVAPNALKNTSTASDFDITCAASNLKYTGTRTKTYTTSMLLKSVVTASIFPSSGQANFTSFTLTVTKPTGQSALKCRIGYVLSATSDAQILSNITMSTTTSGLQDSFKMTLDRALKQDIQTLFTQCYDDTMAYTSRVYTKVTVTQPITTNTLSANSDGFLNP